MKKYILILFAIVFISNYSTAQDQKDCKMTVTETISANSKNGTYITASCGLESFKITISNRMGDQVYTSSDSKLFWNFNEKKADGSSYKFTQGVYKYAMTYKFKGESAAKTKAGKITLLR